MTLKRRLATQISLTVAGVLILGAAAAIGVGGLHQDFSLALEANQQLQHVYTIGIHAGLARAAMEQSPASLAGAQSELKIAAADFEIAPLERSSPPVQALGDALRVALTQLNQNPPGDAALLDRTYAALADLSASIRRSLSATAQAAEQKHLVTLQVVVVTALATAIFAGWIGMRQYRAIIRPLNRLQLTFTQIAAGELDQRAPAAGDLEFALLAAEFNRMAGELQRALDDLKHRVELKSRQLVQSERLASVGYLAAGVAHEINNPLGIIAGYGEQSLRRLERSWSTQSAAPVRQAIQIMCDEAFRCKAITDRLLMLARTGDSARGVVSLAKLASDVIASLGGLPRFAGRTIALRADPEADCQTIGIEGELRQAVLNLLVNALEAVKPSGGRVQVSVRRVGEEIELSVADDGAGMTPETLSRVFEPFFSEKRGERAGTGLGLSVVHAIVAAHGGRIEAQSDGPGEGSRFVIVLHAGAEVCDASRA